MVIVAALLLCERVGATERRLGKRAVTVADTIGMTELGDPAYFIGGHVQNGVAQYSPDRRHFVVVTARGDLTKNTVVYTLLLFRTDEALRTPVPKPLASLASSSNRPAIDDIRWLDNKRLTFLGENPGQSHQLYTVDCESGLLNKLTKHPTNLHEYAMGAGNGELFFTAEDQPLPLVRKHAFGSLVVTTEVLTDLLCGVNSFSAERQQHLFLHKMGNSRVIPIDTKGTIGPSDLSLSPDGRYLIVRTMPTEIPGEWREYQDPHLQLALRPTYLSGPPIYIFQYELIDVRSQQSRILLNAPLGTDPTLAWASDSRAVVISGTFLPLVVGDSAERKKRQTTKFVVEVDIQTGAVLPITSQDVKPLRWNSPTDTLILAPSSYHGEGDAEAALVAFRKAGTGWREAEPNVSDFHEGRNIRLMLVEDMNTPPKVFGVDEQTGQKALLLDLNPQFKSLAFGQVTSVEFSATDGHTVKAGLYFPPNYNPAKRYPLVIQTHGWDPTRFWVNGVYSTAFAAQPLAAQDITDI